MAGGGELALMKSFLLLLSCALFCSQPLVAASKSHVVSFGKWTTVKWLAGETDDQALDTKVRPLLVDGRVKEMTMAVPHDVTDRLFVVQRMYRLNNSLQQEITPRWRWERGGWLLVDRVSGKVQPLALPGFDAYYSTVAWFRDYAAYCGTSEDGTKMLAVVAQIARRKPILKKQLGDSSTFDSPGSACSQPQWERGPSRVTFRPAGQQSFTYAVRSHTIEAAPAVEEDAANE